MKCENAGKNYFAKAVKKETHGTLFYRTTQKHEKRLARANLNV